MANKIKPQLTIINTRFSNEGTRQDVRMRVVNAFAQEKCGSLTERYAYRYNVETLSDGKVVYLKRPANLHNGFDFLVCVDDYDYSTPEERRRRNFPKHEDFTNDLQLKKEENPEEYQKLYALLYKIFNCEEVEDSEMQVLHFTTGLPVDHIAKVLKWLFIEQDIRYWSYSGRNMTWYEAVPQCDNEILETGEMEGAI